MPCKNCALVKPSDKDYNLTMQLTIPKAQEHATLARALIIWSTAPHHRVATRASLYSQLN